MMAELEISTELYDELLEHMDAPEVEHVAFLFTEPLDGSEVVRVRELYRVPPEGFEVQTGYHVSLTDATRAYVIKRAWDSGGTLVEVHSHGGGPPVAFSRSDLAGFEEWVPHVRWRLRKRPYYALVFAGGSFDALAWEGDDGYAVALGAIVVPERGRELPSGLTLARSGRARR